jgi:preprotein translocase subunit SecB
MSDMPADAAAERPTNLTFAINMQYVKDLSFENPRAPQVFTSNQSAPQVQVNVDVGARQVGENVYEITLVLNAEAKAGDDTVFVVELTYAGIFTVPPLPQEQLRPLLLIECPRLLFPFARRVIADATRDGGFPPLLIDPIDFVSLYRMRQQQAEAARQAEDGPVGKPLVGEGAST